MIMIRTKVELAAKNKPPNFYKCNPPLSTVASIAKFIRVKKSIYASLETLILYAILILRIFFTYEYAKSPVEIREVARKPGRVWFLLRKSTGVWAADPPFDGAIASLAGSTEGGCVKSRDDEKEEKLHIWAKAACIADNTKKRNVHTVHWFHKK